MFDDAKIAAKRLRQVKRQLSALGLRLHRSKTFIVDCRKKPFDYLGFQIRSKVIAPSPESIKRLKRELSVWFSPSKIKRSKRLDHINGLLRSFAWYFSVADDKSAFQDVDRYVKSLRQQLVASGNGRAAPSAREVVRISKSSASRRSASGRGRALWNGYSG